MTLPLTSPIKEQVKTIRIKTNNNGKLACFYFCHIQIAGTNGIPESIAEKTTYKFITEDGSHPPVDARLIDSITQRLGEISSAYVWMSHGMERDEFIKNVLLQVKNTTMSTEMKIYFYKKV